MGTVDRVIGLLVPVTSRGRRFTAVADTDFLRLLLPSVLATATWERTRYRVYLGYDTGDPFYDDAARRRAIHAAFRRQAGARPVELTMQACDGTAHAPVAVWNALFRRAYDDGCDFFYQLGDDVVLTTPHWARDFAAALLLNPRAPGLGVTGPEDRNNPGFPVLTQSFVSRLHMDIFGTYYPPVFRNWWSDNWITEVYAPEHLRRCPIHVVHNRGGGERYEIDRAAEPRLVAEVVRGRAAIAAWLAARPANGGPSRARVIAFSLWGREPRYTVGAVRNAELAAEIYPGWTCRFYVGDSVPAATVRRLAALPSTELVGMREEGDWRGLFWRFLAAADESVGVLLVRDADSRLSRREREAVDEWLAGDKDVHIMRDHPHHGVPMLGGMWGVRNGLLWNIRTLIAAYNPREIRWQTDQEFLATLVFPAVHRRALVHDEFFFGRPFPSPRRGEEFVGQVYDEYDRPLPPAARASASQVR